LNFPFEWNAWETGHTYPLKIPFVPIANGALWKEFSRIFALEASATNVSYDCSAFTNRDG